MANTIFRDIQQLSQPSPWVSLFTVDTSILSGAVYHFTPNIWPDGSSLVFGGVTYAPLPMDFSGWEVLASTSGGSSAQPRPNFTISNVNKTLLSVVISLGDLVGSTVTRIRTFAKYLDGQPNADTSQIIGPDVYKIAQKTSHTNQAITWMLTNPVDIPSAQLPARQVLKDPSTLSKGFPGVQVYS